VQKQYTAIYTNPVGYNGAFIVCSVQFATMGTQSVPDAFSKATHLDEGCITHLFKGWPELCIVDSPPQTAFEEAFNGQEQKQDYHPGKPPKVGWWPTSTSMDYEMRWWDGKYWSVFCTKKDAEEGTLDEETSNRTRMTVLWAHPWW